MIYRLGTTLPGWLTSASTRREGIVTLTDLTRTLIDFGAVQARRPPPSMVRRWPSTGRPHGRTACREHLRAIAALSDTIPPAYVVLGAWPALLVAIGVVGACGARPSGARLPTVGRRSPAP